MTDPAKTRMTIQVVFMAWASSNLGMIGADWLTSVGVGEWTAVWAVAAAPFAVLLIGFPYRRRTGLRSSWRQFLPLWMSGPAVVLGVSGLVTGAASRGHVFVLIFTGVPIAIFLVILTVGLRRAVDRPVSR